MDRGRSRLVVCALLVAACSGNGSGGAGPTATFAISGPDGSVPSPYDVLAGDRLVIELRGTAGTGYEWTAVAIPPIVAQRGAATSACIGEWLPGCAQATTFDFDVVAAGEWTLTFEYAQPWMTGVPPAQTFAVTLRAR